MENTLLNLIPAAYLPEIHLSQYDVGRTITFTLKDGASDYSVPSGASVKVKATKPSGFGFEVACTFNGGTVTLVTTDTMTPENGRFPAELSIVSGNTTIGTSNFIFNIERSPHPEGTIDGDAETIIPELTLLVERIEAAAEDVDEKAELFLNLSAEAETLPAGSLATANYSDGVLTLGIPRGYDGDDTKADAIIKSASGEVASFTDGGNGLLVKSLNVNIVPKQSGSGDPSPDNVRPISGWDSIDVTRCGKNLVDLSVMYFNDSEYTHSHFPTSAPIKKFFDTLDLLKGQTITLSRKYTGTSSGVTIGQIRIQLSDTATVIYPDTPYTIPDRDFKNAQWAVIYGSASGASVTDIQLELGSTATAYEPYQGTSYPISLGQTVYGGTLDVLSGVLTINKGMAELGSLTWAKETNGNRFSASIPNTFKQISGGVVINAICSMYKVSSRDFVLSTNNAFSVHYSAGANYLNIHDDNAYSTMTAEQFKTYVNGQTLVCELQTPITVQLTANQVTTLLGNNNIWADSGSVEVEYRADTTLAYNELLSLIASL